MAAADVATAAALQLMSMADKGKEEGILVATVTVPVNATTGEVRNTNCEAWPINSVIFLGFYAIIEVSEKISTRITGL